ncbi:MAG TPA: hypothetical protein VES69_14245 [Pyrinomonadaceae bacterium]|nr:hypothetical protein [Pyrinomonadaceae bacterium]
MAAFRQCGETVSVCFFSMRERLDRAWQAFGSRVTAPRQTHGLAHVCVLRAARWRLFGDEPDEAVMEYIPPAC